MKIAGRSPTASKGEDAWGVMHGEYSTLGRTGTRGRDVPLDDERRSRP
jgi:hypothetical protein